MTRLLDATFESNALTGTNGVSATTGTWSVDNTSKINNPLLIATLLCFGEVLPEAELKVLSVLIKYSNGGCIGLGLEVVKEYRKEAPFLGGYLLYWRLFWWFLLL